MLAGLLKTVFTLRDERSVRSVSVGLPARGVSPAADHEEPNCTLSGRLRGRGGTGGPVLELGETGWCMLLLRKTLLVGDGLMSGSCSGPSVKTDDVALEGMSLRSGWVGGGPCVLLYSSGNGGGTCCCGCATRSGCCGGGVARRSLDSERRLDTLAFATSRMLLALKALRAPSLRPLRPLHAVLGGLTRRRGGSAGPLVDVLAVVRAMSLTMLPVDDPDPEETE